MMNRHRTPFSSTLLPFLCELGALGSSHESMPAHISFGFEASFLETGWWSPYVGVVDIEGGPAAVGSNSDSLEWRGGYNVPEAGQIQVVCRVVEFSFCRLNMGFFGV
jgi:hypothetical protein